MDLYATYIIYDILILLILVGYILKFNIRFKTMIRKYYHYYGKFIKFFLFIILLRSKNLIKIFLNLNLKIDIDFDEIFSTRTFENLREMFVWVYLPIIPSYMISNLSVHFPRFLNNQNVIDLEHRIYFLEFFYHSKTEKVFFFFDAFFWFGFEFTL